MTENDKKDIALFRFSIIAPLITSPEKYKSNNAFFKAASIEEYTYKNEKIMLSEATIEGYYYKYKEKGLDGLIPRIRKDNGEFRKLDKEILDRIKEIKINKPRMTAKGIYKLLLDEYKEHSTSYSTVLRAYNKLNDKDTRPTDKQMLRYELKYSNDLWCADTSHGPYLYIKNDNGKIIDKVKLYIIAFIDDASRLITACKIYDSDNTINLIATFKSAVKTYGKPKKLNLDNGSNYRSKELALVSAKLGVSLHYDPVHTPTSKAKIERFFRTLKDQWLSSIDYNDFKSIEEYQVSLNEYIREYNTRVHSSLNGLSPINRRDKDLESIIYINDNELDDDFLIEIERNISPDSVVRISNKEFTVPYRYSGYKRARFMYSYDFSEVYIINGEEKIKIEPLNKVENSTIERKYRLTDED